MGIRVIKDDDEFDRIMLAYKLRKLPIFVQFVTNRKLVNTYFTKLESLFSGIFISVDIDLCPMIVKKHTRRRVGVQGCRHGSTPVYKVFRDGRERASIVHACISNEQLFQLVNEHTDKRVLKPPPRPPRPYHVTEFGENLGER